MVGVLLSFAVALAKRVGKRSSYSTVDKRVISTIKVCHILFMFGSKTSFFPSSFLAILSTLFGERPV